jgi:hypothetical protein
MHRQPQRLFRVQSALLLATWLFGFSGLEGADYRIKVPSGMKMVQTQIGNTVEITFVPIDSPAAAPVPRATPVAEPSPPSATATPAARLTTGDQLVKERSALNFDRPLNAAPAFVALDVTPETVDSPSTPREFGASLLNGLDRKGVLQSGLALQAAPYQILAGRQTSLTEYRDSYLTRLLYNTSLSIGTTKASSDNDQAVRLALGLSLTLFDNGDPRMNPAIQQLFDNVNREVPHYEYDTNLNEAQNAAAETAHYAGFADPNKLFLEGLEKIRAQSWGRTSWNVAWAPTWVSPTGKAGDLESEGFTTWSTFALGFEDVRALKGRLQFLAHLRYRANEMTTDANEVKFKQDTLFAAGRLRWGRADLNFSLEGAYLRTWHGPDGNGSAFRVGVGLEKKVSENIWLVVSAGEDFGGSGSDELFAVGALRFGSSDSPQFTP